MTAVIPPACCAGADHGKTRSQLHFVGCASGHGLAFAPAVVGVGAVTIALADAGGRMCRVLSDANAKPIPHANAVGFAVSDAKPHIDPRDQRTGHQRAGGG